MVQASTFEDLFTSTGTTYEIPPYQRAYAWKDKQVKQFLDDLRDQPAGKTYYLGHFLFEQPDAGKRHFYVIDGQQRMTTAVLFFSTLLQELERRQKLGEALLDPDDDQPVDFRHWQERYFELRKVRRFRTVKDDDAFFERAFIRQQSDAQPNPARQSQLRLVKARELMKQEMQKPGTETATLLRWAKLIGSATVTRFEEPNKVRATQIFAFQNDRGIDLTVLEKLKAFLMYRAYLDDSSAEVTHTIEHVERVFAHIYARIEEIGLGEDTVLRYHNIAFGNRHLDAFEYVKRKLNDTPSADRAAWIRDFCDSLNESFDTVRDVEKLASGHSYATGLLIMQQESNWPLLLKIQRRHGADQVLREELFRLMEIVSFKMEFTTGTYRTNDFHRLANEYRGDSGQLRADLRYRAQHGFQEYWAFTRNFHDKLDGDYHYDPITRYLLWQYENHLRHQSPNSRPSTGAEFRNEWKERKWDNWLDHITPQQPKEIVYTEEFRESRLHNLGNLALMMMGPQLAKSNTLPHDYPEIFEKSTNLADHEIAQLMRNAGRQWGEAEILTRKARIVAFAKEFWAVRPEGFVWTDAGAFAKEFRAVPAN